MACLDNYILVKGSCGDATPTSGLYINVNLPGITLAKAANTAEDAFTTGVSLLNQSITNGISRTRQELIGAMLGTVKFGSILSGSQYGYYNADDFDDDTKYLAGSATGRGLKLELRNNCRLSHIYVKRVGVIGKGTGAKVLSVTDGVTVTNYAFTLTNQTITWVEVNQEIQSDLAFIKIADATFQPLDTLLNYTGTCGFCANDCSGASGCGCNEGLNIWGWDGTNTNSQTYGLIPLVQVICSPDKFFCEVSSLEMVRWASLYASGVDFMGYLINTNRLNAYTIYETEEAANLVTDWEAKFQSNLNKLVKTLPRYLSSIDTCCLTCDADSWSYAHP